MCACVVQRGQLRQKVVWGQLHYSWSKINLKKKKRMLKPRSIIFKFSTHNKQQLKAKKKKKEANKSTTTPPLPPQAKHGRQNQTIPTSCAICPTWYGCNKHSCRSGFWPEYLLQPKCVQNLTCLQFYFHPDCPDTRVQWHCHLCGESHCITLVICQKLVLS